MKTLTVCAGILTVFFIAACGFETEPTFNFDLQGTWKTNNAYDYWGELIIDNGKITITGYDQPTPSGGNDGNRPFKNFTQNKALKCRWTSEESKSKDRAQGILFITDQGEEKEGIPFLYWEGDLWYDSSSSIGYRADKFLRFTFGNRVEILENTENHK